MRRPVLRVVVVVVVVGVGCWRLRCWARMDETKAQTLPLPLVPATWITLRRLRSSGFFWVGPWVLALLGGGGGGVHTEMDAIENSRCGPDEPSRPSCS